MRGLMREQNNLNESLSKIEDENHHLESVNSELNTMININQNSIVEK